MGVGKFRPPQLRNRLTDFGEIRTLELTSEDHPPRKISFRSDDVGGLGECPVCHSWVSGFVFLFFWCLSFFFGLFVTRIGRTDFDDLYVIWRLSAQGCAFWGFVDMPPHLGGQIPKKNNFGGLNRHFPAKLVKSKKMHIIKTTASIPTKFCTVIKTTKCRATQLC